MGAGQRRRWGGNPSLEIAGPIESGFDAAEGDKASTLRVAHALPTMTSSGIFAISAAAGFLAIAAFEGLLALGVPWGRAAWGGTHVRLPRRLRAASAVTVPIYAFAASIVLGRAGLWGGGSLDSLFEWGTWVLVGGMALGAVLNLASRSQWERYIMSPVALVLSLLCLGVSLASA